jgi:hypothetical protein
MYVMICVKYNLKGSMRHTYKFSVFCLEERDDLGEMIIIMIQYTYFFRRESYCDLNCTISAIYSL